jgi:apolipoprotein N-acyltransferase
VLSFLRYKLLYFYPAGYLAVTQAEFTHFIQLAELGGFWLLTLLMLLVNAFLFQFLFEKKYKNLIYICLIFLLIFGYGSLRLNQLQELQPEFSLGLITTNIIQDIKWDNNQLENNTELMLQSGSELREVELIIAPETNITFDFGRKSNRKENLLKEIDSRFQVPLQFGTLSSQAGSDQKFNSSFLISAEGEILERYNKNRLLYFGEKYPGEELINALLPYHFSSLRAGEESENFSNGNLSWKNAICSEILYSDYLLAGAAEADFIVNQTNEAWFQDSELLKNLMLSSAVLRAVENRRTVVKVGNLAHDALISPAGNYERLPEAEIYQSRKIILNKDQTFYQRSYQFLELILWALTAFLMLIYFRKIK